MSALCVLAQVDQLWENEHDSFKMMKCRWYTHTCTLTHTRTRTRTRHLDDDEVALVLPRVGAAATPSLFLCLATL